MLTRSPQLAVLTLLLLATPSANAQPAAAPPANRKAEPPAVAQPASPAPSSPTQASPTQASPAPTEPPPESDDVMLAPVPAPRTIVSGWQEALRLAKASDPDYSVSLLEVERQRGVERQALAGALPTLSASGTLTFNLIRTDVTTVDFDSGALIERTIPASPVLGAAVTLRQPLIAPRAWYAIGTAAANTQATKTSSEDRQRTLTVAVADAVVGVVTAERLAEINRVGLRAALRRRDLQKRRLELGSGTLLDVVRFEQDVAIARGTLIEGDERLRQSRERLGALLGLTEQVGVTPQIDLNGIARSIVGVCKPGKLEDRADLRAQKQQVALAERAVTDAELLYSPTADATATFSGSSEDLIGDKNYAFSIQGLLTIPLFDGGLRYGLRQSAVAVTQQRNERLDAATRVASIEVTQAERAAVVATSALEVAKTGRDLAMESDKLAQRAFEEGAGTSFDLVEASRRLRQSELELALRELELVRARVAALLATANCSY